VGVLLTGLAVAQDGSSPSTLGTPPPAAGSSFGDSIKNGWNKFTQAITPEPRVNPAPDATALSTPAKPGPELYVAIGRVAEQQGKFDQAEEQYQRALKLSEKDLGALMAMARLRDRQNRFDEALQYYHRAFQANPKEAGVFNDLGLCLAKRQMYPDSITAIRKAVQLQPQKPLYHDNLASVLVETGDMEGAYAQLRAVHDEPEAYYDLGYLMFLKGNRQAAAALFTKALQAKPSLTEARLFLEKLGPVRPAEPAVQPRYSQPVNQPAPPNPVAQPRYSQPDNQPAPPNPVAQPRYPQPATQPRYPELLVQPDCPDGRPNGPPAPMPPGASPGSPPGRPFPPADWSQGSPPSGPEIPGATSIPRLPPVWPQMDTFGPGSREVPYMASRTDVQPRPTFDLLPPAANGLPFGDRLPGNVVPLPPVPENGPGQ
jgi:Flp pilus assembly protein TadD